VAKPKILLVDADLKSRQMLEISLKKGGFTVTSCGEGEKALQLVDTLLPDLIVADIDLAGSMDGFLFCEVLKENPEHRRIPFIFLSKRKSVEDKIRGLELGVDDYLTKPIYLKELLARVRMILEKMRQESFDQSGSDPQFQGDLSQMSVVDLLQTMEMGGKTGVVHLDHGGRAARLFCRQGRIVHAVVDNLVGERAVYRALLWNDGGFRIDFRNTLQTQETIQVSTQGLIMEGMRRLDELERLKEQLPPLSTYLGIDSQTILDEHPDRFPAKIENILAEFNGEKTLEEVVESLPYDDLESLEIISKLYFQGFLLEIDTPPTAADVGSGTGVGGATAGGSTASSGAARLPGGGSTLDTQMLNLEEASRSIEEIKKRARLGVGSNAVVPNAEPSPAAAPPVETPASPPKPAALGELGDDTGFELAAPDWDDDGAEGEATAASAGAAPPPAEGRTKVSADLAAKAAAVVRAEDAPARRSVGQPRVVDDPEAVAALFDLQPKPPAPQPAQPPAPSPVQPAAPKASAAPDVAVSEATDAGAPSPAPPPSATEARPLARIVPSPPPDDAATPAAAKPSAQSAPKAAGAAPAKSGGAGRWVAVAAVLALLAGGAAWRLSGGDSVPPADAYALTEQAEAALAEARVSEALRLAEQAIGLDGRLGRAHAARGRALAQIGRTDDAIAAFGDALRSTPTLHDARLNELSLRFARGDAPRGLQTDLQTLLVKLDPSADRVVWLDATFLSARLAIAVEDWTTARRQLQAASAAAPDDVRIPTLTAKIPEPPKPPAPAPAAPPVASSPPIKPVAKAAARAPVAAPAAAPVNARRLADEGMALYRKGKLGDAEVKLRAAVAAAPDDADVLVDLGRVLVERGRDDQALEVFLRAGSLDPRNARVYVNLGSVYMFKGDRERARKAYEAYLTLVPASSKDAREIRKVMENL
jgi:CheY-like chemotaxis protein/Flp pilus assembly protein TadD